MSFPLSLLDISLWLAVMAVIVLITSELLYSLPQYSGRVIINKKNLRMVAVLLTLAFLVTVALRVFQTF